MPISAEHRELLDRPGTFARLATIMPDGSPQLTVMAFRRDGDTLRMTCEPRAVKARNIRRDGRVAVVVEAPEGPHHFVQMRGSAVVDDDPATGWAEIEAQARRYLGDQAESYLKTVEGDPAVAIIVYPEKFSEYFGQLPD